MRASAATQTLSMWGTTAGRAVVVFGRARDCSRGARAPHARDKSSGLSADASIGRYIDHAHATGHRALAVQMWGATAGRGRGLRRARDRSRGARAPHGQDDKPGPSADASIGRYTDLVDVGRDRRARGRGLRRARDCSRGARAPHARDKSSGLSADASIGRYIDHAHATGYRALAVQMWGATAGRAVVVFGGQETARAAREPHTDKTTTPARRPMARAMRLGRPPVASAWPAPTAPQARGASGTAFRLPPTDQSSAGAGDTRRRPCGCRGRERRRA